MMLGATILLSMHGMVYVWQVHLWGPQESCKMCADAGNKSGVWSKVKITVDIDTIVAAVSQAVQDGHYIQFNLVLDADVKLP